MKANKFFMVAMATLTAVAFAACGGGNTPDDPKDDPKDDPTALTITPNKADLEIGGTVTLKANKNVTWEAVSSTNSVELSATEGAEVVVTAKAAGAATVIASVGSEQEFVTINVKGAQQAGGHVIEASEIYPVILDGITFEANKDKVVSDFRVNDETSHLYIWTAGETYNAGEGSGLNFFGNNEGYVSLTVAAAGWSGGGFSLEANYGEALQALINKIIAEPDKYYFHIGMKSTDNVTHWLYLMGVTPECDVVVGASAFNDNGTIHNPVTDFKRNGAWQSVEVSMAAYVAGLQKADVAAGTNIVAFLSGGATGAQLNMDACYFYKK